MLLFYLLVPKLYDLFPLDLYAVSRTSSSMLNNSDDRGNPYVVYLKKTMSKFIHQM